jgi:hypothetical protein
MGSELQYVLYFVPLHKGTCEEIKLVACPVSRIGFPVKKPSQDLILLRFRRPSFYHNVRKIMW